MNQALSNDAKAILLLCASLGKNQAGPDPLSPGKYNILAHWLSKNGMRPGDLFEHQDDLVQMKDFPNKKLDVDGILSLLNRGYLLAQTLEELGRVGIRVCCRSEENYPSQYKKKLREKAPPFFYYAGNFALVQRGGLAIVGSRDLDAEGEAFARRVGGQCAEQGVTVISGGARGADTLAMFAALEEGGSAIGVLCDKLRAKSISKNFRKFLSEERLLLLSPYSPDAPFRAWAAMERNKFIYALADGALVVSSGVSSSSKKSGTWEGVMEELKRPDHLPVFVRDTDTPEGNRLLLGEMGALPWAEPAKDIRELIKESVENTNLKQLQQASMFQKKPSGNNTAVIVSPEAEEHSLCFSQIARTPLSLYEHFLPLLLDNLRSPLSIDEIFNLFPDTRKSQLREWIKKAVQEKKVHRYQGRPVRYSRETQKTTPEQGSLLALANAHV